MDSTTLPLSAVGARMRGLRHAVDSVEEHVAQHGSSAMKQELRDRLLAQLLRLQLETFDRG